MLLPGTTCFDEVFTEAVGKTRKALMEAGAPSLADHWCCDGARDGPTGLQCPGGVARLYLQTISL